MQSEHYGYKSQRNGRLPVAIVFTTILMIVMIVVLDTGSSPSLWNGGINKSDTRVATEMQQPMADDVASSSYRAPGHEATDDGDNRDASSPGYSARGEPGNEARKMVAKLLSANGCVTLSMPCPEIFLPAEKLFSSDWIDPLLQFLSGLTGSEQVGIVAANDAYLDVLLNWLITATVVVNPAMRSVLVLALDKLMYDILHEREIPCIYVPLQSVLNESTRIMTSPFQRKAKALLMIRLGFLRILNWLGFDAASIDADALILKNPRPLFENHKTDIVGSIGLPWPHEVFEKWNLTLCGGVIFIRSNKRTGKPMHAPVSQDGWTPHEMDPGVHSS